MSAQSKRHPVGDTRTFIAAAGATCVANATWWMQPVLMHEFTSLRGFGEASAGVVLSVEMGAMALASALLARFAVNRSLLLVALGGTLLAIFGSFFSLGAGSYDGLLAARIAAGLGAGAALMMSNTVAAAFSDPDKIFARLGVINLVFGTLLVGAMPFVRSHVSGSVAFTTLLASLVIMVIPVLFMEPRAVMAAHPPQEHHEEAHALRKNAVRNIIMMSIVTLLIGVASGTVWAFYGVIGERAGLPVEQVDAAISTAILTAIGGAGLAAVMGGRFGRIIPSTVALLLMAGAIVALTFTPTPTVFRIATCVNLSAIYFLLPYLLGAGAAQDDTGRGAAFVGSAFFFTGAISPALGGILAVTVGMQVVGIAVVFIAILSCLMIVRVERTTPQHGVDMSGESPVQALHKAV